MKNIQTLVKLTFVAILVLFTFVFSGCALKQDVIHSNAVYPTETINTQIETITDTLTPLAAPKIVADNNAVTVTLICDYQVD